MPIDRDKLLQDIKFWLPDSNVLIDEEILYLAEIVIARVGDDETNYAEVLCKSLEACALANQAKHSVDSAALKSEKVGESTEVYATEILKDVWKDYINSLKDICPLFGYTGLSSSAIGMKINSGTRPVVNDCLTHIDLFY